MLKLFKRNNPSGLSAVEAGQVYMPAKHIEMREIERCFARVFSSDDGQKIIGYLQSVTFQRALGMEATDSHLRHIEGQRALVAKMLRLIDRGRHGA